MKFKLLAPVLAAVISVYMLIGVLQASDLPLANGDFEGGDLNGWTLFLTANGTQLSAPTVVSFDMGGDGTPSSVAQFQLGSTNADYGGGGIYQIIHLDPGTYTVSAEIAVYDDAPVIDNTSIGAVDKPGFFELLVDGVMVDNLEFGRVAPSKTLTGNLAFSIDSPHEIRLRISRPHQAASKLYQMIDNVKVAYKGGSSPSPEPTATPEPAPDPGDGTSEQAAAPLAALQSVIDDLQGIIDSNPETPLADSMEDVLKKVQTALDECGKSPPDDQAALGNIEGAVGDLEAAVKDGLLDSGEGTVLMDRLASVARGLTVVALDEAYSLTVGNRTRSRMRSRPWPKATP